MATKSTAKKIAKKKKPSASVVTAMRSLIDQMSETADDMKRIKRDHDKVRQEVCDALEEHFDDHFEEEDENGVYRKGAVIRGGSMVIADDILDDKAFPSGLVHKVTDRVVNQDKLVEAIMAGAIEPKVVEMITDLVISPEKLNAHIGEVPTAVVRRHVSKKLNKPYAKIERK